MSRTKLEVIVSLAFIAFVSLTTGHAQSGIPPQITTPDKVENGHRHTGVQRRRANLPCRRCVTVWTMCVPYPKRLSVDYADCTDYKELSANYEQIVSVDD
jgi:hypothetical protein